MNVICKLWHPRQWGGGGSGYKGDLKARSWPLSPGGPQCGVLDGRGKGREVGAVAHPPLP